MAYCIFFSYRSYSLFDSYGHKYGVDAWLILQKRKGRTLPQYYPSQFVHSYLSWWRSLVQYKVYDDLQSSSGIIFVWSLAEFRSPSRVRWIWSYSPWIDKNANCSWLPVSSAFNSPYDLKGLNFLIDGWTTEDLVFLWKSVDPVQVTDNLHLPRFTLEKFITDYCNSKTNTGNVYSNISNPF